MIHARPYNNFNRMWLGAVHDIMRLGGVLNSRAGMTKEVIGYSASMDNVQHALLTMRDRALSPYYACAELLWYVAESKKAEMILAYAPSYSRFIDLNGDAWGHYGHRWKTAEGFQRFNNARFASQVDACIEMLMKQPASRQCVLSIWNAGDLMKGLDEQSKDVPCTLCLQFVLRSGRLHCITTMRSNDVWLGMPYDVYCFTSMQKLVAAAIGVVPGWYTHNVGSMHAYEKNHDALWKLEEEYHSGALVQDVYVDDHEKSASPIDYRNHVERALLIEVTSRSKRMDVIPVQALDGVHPVLRDAALVCALKWYPHQEDLFEAISCKYLKGLVDVDRRRTRSGGKDDAVPRTAEGSVGGSP